MNLLAMLVLCNAVCGTIDGQQAACYVVDGMQQCCVNGQCVPAGIDPTPVPTPTPTPIPTPAQSTIFYGPKYGPLPGPVLSIDGDFQWHTVRGDCVPLPSDNYHAEIDLSVCATNGSKDQEQYCEVEAFGMQVASETTLIVSPLDANKQNTEEGPFHGACAGAKWVMPSGQMVLTDCGNGQMGFEFGIQIRCTEPALVPQGNNVSVYGRFDYVTEGIQDE